MNFIACKLKYKVKQSSLIIEFSEANIFFTFEISNK